MAPISKLAFLSALLGSQSASLLVAANDVELAETGGIYEEAMKELRQVRHEAKLEHGEEASSNLRVAEERRLGGLGGARHASTHLNYDEPTDSMGQTMHIQSWFSELIPKHSSADTYFSVLGHKYGYFGLQQIEKPGMSGFWFQGKVVFSIWDQGCNGLMDPNACPADQKAEIVECGPTSACTSFGGEGTGAKTYMDFHEWGVEQQYGFVTQIWDEGPKVQIASWFFAGELGGWMLMGKLRVKKGNAEARIYTMYSFCEQWSARDFDDVRFARYGPSYVELKNGNQWKQLLTVAWRHTDAPGEVVNHVYGNVTHGNQLWGMGLGGNLPKTQSGTKLKVQPYPAIPAILTEWQNLRANNQLPAGCLGGTCMNMKIQAVLNKALTWQYIPITGILGLIVILLIYQCIASVCFVGNGKVQPAAQGRQMQAGVGQPGYGPPGYGPPPGYGAPPGYAGQPMPPRRG